MWTATGNRAIWGLCNCWSAASLPSPSWIDWGTAMDTPARQHFCQTLRHDKIKHKRSHFDADLHVVTKESLILVFFMYKVWSIAFCHLFRVLKSKDLMNNCSRWQSFFCFAAEYSFKCGKAEFPFVFRTARLKRSWAHWWCLIFHQPTTRTSWWSI